MSSTILVVDDHEIFRTEVRLLLDSQADFEVVGEATDGRSAIALAKTLRPDLVLIELTLPLVSGLEAIRRILLDDSTARLLVLSIHSERRLVDEALRAGALAYVTKDVPATELLRAIRAAVAGEQPADPAAR